MRDFINKNLSEEQILKAVDTCYQNGLDGLKIYAMAGFPNETEDYLFELMNLMKKIYPYANQIVNIKDMIQKQKKLNVIVVLKQNYH